jgi:hypothetical protein
LHPVVCKTTKQKGPQMRAIYPIAGSGFETASFGL